jgi:hypothetical protein
MAGALTAMIAAAFSGVTPDPYFEYTTLLLPGNGTNGAQNNTFLDGSSNNFTITRNGNTTQGTFSPFSQTGWGNYFNGSSYLSATSNAAFTLTGDFCVEFWVYSGLLAGGATNPTFINDSAGSNSSIFYETNGSNRGLCLYAAGAARITTATNVLVENQWNHVAILRSGTTGTNTAAFVNGTRVGTATAFTGTVDFSPPIINKYGPSAAGYLNGYMSNFRIVKGAPVYDPTLTTLTVPTAPLTAISGTSLLICQSNRFRDASTNNFAVTPNGSPSVQAFSPFNPTASWSAATNGGSGYFDGNGDYLSNGSAPVANFGTNDFTFEFWVYFTAMASAPYYQIFSSTASIGGFQVYKNASSNNLVWDINGTSTDLILTGLVSNQWYHIAVARSGTNLRTFANGVLTYTYTNSTNFTITGAYIGSYPTGASYFPGYISGLRVVKGTAVYTSNFTPPTAPPTAITNTSLLLNFTNAGIYDATSKNDLETVGNAQISTTQSKWGGSSISFDGTGDYLLPNVATSDMYAFGTGDFTIEFWVRYNSGLNVDVALYDSRPTSTNGVYPLLFSNPTGKMVYYVSSAARITGTTTLVAGNWYHVALARSGTSTKLFINGSQEGSTYTDSNNYIVGTNRPAIGAAGIGLGADPLNGYIQDLRVTKGYARYTANFTAPTAAFPTL